MYICEYIYIYIYIYLYICIYIIGVVVRTREALFADYADDLAWSDSDLASDVGHGDEGSDVEVVCRDSKQNEVRVAVGMGGQSFASSEKCSLREARGMSVHARKGQVAGGKRWGFDACISHVSLDVQVHAEDPWDADRAVIDSDSAEEVANGRPEAPAHLALRVHTYACL